MMYLSKARWYASALLALATSLNLAAAQEFTPLKKGSQDGFSSQAVSNSAGEQSPSVALFQRGKKIAAAHSMCVNLINDSQKQRSLPIALGALMRLRFHHSIYGSHVEEIFTLRQNGFELVELRYGEARLVDFYGHEHGRFDNGTWVVKPAPALIPRLDLQASHDAELSVEFAPQQSHQPIVVQPNSALRLTVEPCKSSADG